MHTFLATVICLCRERPDNKEAKLTAELFIGQSASSASVTPQGCIDNTSAENAGMTWCHLLW